MRGSGPDRRRPAPRRRRSRALFAGDTKRFEGLVERWPKDIREYAVNQAREASRADREMPA
jgi:hypothetical protein